MRIDFEFNGKSLEDFVRRNPVAVKLNGNDSSDDQSIFTKKDDEDTSKAPKISQEQIDEWLEQTGRDPGFYKQNSGVEDSEIHIISDDSEKNNPFKMTLPEDLTEVNPENLIDKLNNGERRLTDNVIIGIDVWGRGRGNEIGGIGGGIRFPGGGSVYFPEDEIQDLIQGSGGSVNGEIDASRQGHKGDCWLLAGLNSLSYSENGSKIIKDVIEINEDGTYTVNFKGINTKVTITKEDLAAARRSGVYSSGDEDVLLMEIATEKVMDQIRNDEINNVPDFLEKTAKEEDNSIKGGLFGDIIYLLTGHNTHFAYNDNDKLSMLNSLKNNPEELAMTTRFKEQENGNAYTVKDVNGNPVELITQHAWSIKSFDGETVTIVNPWNSSIEYKIPKDEYLKYAERIEYYEYNGDHSTKKEGRIIQIYP